MFVVPKKKWSLMTIFSQILDGHFVAIMTIFSQ